MMESTNNIAVEDTAADKQDSVIHVDAAANTEELADDKTNEVARCAEKLKKVESIKAVSVEERSKEDSARLAEYDRAALALEDEVEEDVHLTPDMAEAISIAAESPKQTSTIELIGEDDNAPIPLAAMLQDN